MANAKKCNRCERCFDPLKMEGMMCRFSNPIFQSSDDIRANRVGARLINDSPDAYVDLCPECAEMHEAFMCHGDIPTYIPGQDTDGDQYEVFKNCVIRYTSGEKEIKRLQAELENEKRKHEKAADKMFEDLAGIAEENDWLYEMPNVEKTHDIWPLIGKLKAEVLDALQEWNAEEIKKKFIDGMERLFYGETPKVEKNKCAGCRGSEGECPFHVKPMCDKTKGANK